MLNYFVAFLIVAFGQPAFSISLSVISSFLGYALFWAKLIQEPSTKKRFWYSTLWFFAVQAVQLSWLVSHPYIYIYGLYLFLCLAIGLQFGVIGIFIVKERIQKWTQLFGIAGLFTLFEWARLFFLSGFSLNPIGLTITGTLLGLQGASLFGVYGLTFFILLTNLIALRFYVCSRNFLSASAFAAVALLPYIFGFFHLSWHQQKVPSDSLNALLIQTAFPVEESLGLSVNYVEHEWEEIFKVLKTFENQKVDLIVLPEYVVPYGTYVAVFPYSKIANIFEKTFGSETLSKLPLLKEPLAYEVNQEWKVTNAYLCQAIAELFQADVVVGLQDDQWDSDLNRESYSSAFYFWPGGDLGFRYEKRVLLPMGEYIPFDFCKKIALKYGITGSFRPGTEAKVFPGTKIPFAPSVCYEETFGNLMREGRLNGAKLLVNSTSDVWYPHSRLPKQHFDHARLRTVEMGIPLVRSCNTGITGGIDSLGEVIGCTTPEDEWVRQGLFLKVPLYHYSTLYLMLGDSFIILFSALSTLFLFKKSS